MEKRKCLFFSLLGITLGLSCFSAVSNNESAFGADAYFEQGKIIFITNDGGQNGGWLSDGAKLKINYCDQDGQYHNSILSEVVPIANSDSYIFKYTLAYDATTMQILRMDSQGDSQWNYTNSIDLTNVSGNLFTLNNSIGNGGNFSASSASINHLSVGESENGFIKIVDSEHKTDIGSSAYVYSDHWFDIVATPEAGYYLNSIVSSGDDKPSANNPVLQGTTSDNILSGLFLKERDIKVGNVDIEANYVSSTKEYVKENVFIEKDQIIQGKYHEDVYYDLFVEDHDLDFIGNVNNQAVCLETGYYNIYLKSNDNGQNYPNIYIASADLIAVNNFINSYLHMNDYDADKTGFGEGLCRSYYQDALNGYNSLNEYGKKIFNERDEFKDAKARYDAWTQFNTTNPTGLLYNKKDELTLESEDSAALLTVIAGIASSALLGAYILNKKKHC